MVGAFGLVVEQLLAEVPDLDDLPKMFFLLSESKESYPVPQLIL